MHAAATGGAGHGAVTVYTDGSCLGNPGRGGWAYLVPDSAFASGFEPRTTNQRMEITAALEALRALLPGSAGGMVVISDSTYVVNCFRDRWWEGWRRRNWRNTAGKPVANRDLWEPLFELALDPEASITWQWVKGHSGDQFNDEVDRLAVEAATAGVGSSGLLPRAGD
jgi:ribonuclease HI